MDKEERLKRELARQKATGYAAQKKYRRNNPDVARSTARKSMGKSRNKVKGTEMEVYSARVPIRMKYKSVLEDLLKEQNLTIAELFLSAVEEKYGVTLHEKT